jgi:hypothetical protein
VELFVLISHLGTVFVLIYRLGTVFVLIYRLGTVFVLFRFADIFQSKLNADSMTFNAEYPNV